MYIKHGGSREHGCSLSELLSVSSSEFEYENDKETKFIRVIDYDYDMVDFKLTSDDIIYIDTSASEDTYKSSDYVSPNAGKIEWSKKFLGIGVNVWYFDGLFGRKVPGAVSIGYDCKKTWMKFIKEKFGIDHGIQTTNKLFGNVVIRQPTMCNDAPWPVPKMTITIPKFVNIESIKHNREKGEIEIIFG